MSNGYQVGYLDDGEFVEVGRFNNLDSVANSDLEIRHADSETRVVLGDDGFDFDGSDVAGVNALDVQSASVPQVTSNVDMNNNNLSGVSQLTTGSASVDTVASNVDFDSNDATGIGILEAERLTTGRSWQNVESSRAFNTTETNLSDSEIALQTRITVDSGGDVALKGRVDGSDTFDFRLTDASEGDRYTVVISNIPTDSNYQVFINDESKASIAYWREFRP